MRPLRAWLLRVRGLFAGAARDAELSAELESHLQLHIDDNIRSGMTPDAARRHAVLALGGVEPVKEKYRDRRGLPFLDTLRQDVTYAVRSLRRTPAFTATAVLTLALGIGANAAIFSMVNATLLRPLPFRDPGRLVLVFASDGPGNGYDVTSYPAFADWREQNHSFDSMAAYATRAMTIATGNETLVVGGKRVTPGLFETLGVAPAIGRTFSVDEQRPGSGAVAILSHAFWTQHYGGSPSVIGQVLRVNDAPCTIVGVLPREFRIEDAANEEIFLPQPIDAERGHEFLRVVARLRGGTSMAEAQSDLDRIALHLARVYPRYHTGVGAHIMSMSDGLARDMRMGLFTMLAVVGLVLLIACANVAGLMLARGSSRHHELAIRAALGAARTRLVRQLLTESVLLAAAGGALGLGAAGWTAHLLSAALAKQFRVPGLDAVRTDGSVFLFTIAVSLATCIVFGALPAFLSASPDLNHSLRDAGRSATGRRAPRLRSGLVVVEMALAIVLLAGAGALMKTFLALRATHPGFDAQHVLAVDLSLPQPRFATQGARTQFFDAALRSLHGVPGVRSAAFVADLPLNGSTDGQGFHIVGRPDPAPGKIFSSGFNIATAGYFGLMGIPIRSGREFRDSDGAAALPVIVVNEAAANRFWPDESPLGRQIDLPVGKSTLRLTVIGVTGDVRHETLATPPRPEIFANSMQSPVAWPSLVAVVRAHGEPAPLAEAVKTALRAADPLVPVMRVSTLEAIVSASIGEPRLYACLLGTFAALAVILAAVGLYGLIAYTVTERTHELGVRIALGADRATIVRLVLGQGLRLAVSGAAIGLAVAFAATRLLVSLVKGVEPHDAATFGVVTAVLLGSALLATYLPAYRAARVDPMIALRAE